MSKRLVEIIEKYLVQIIVVYLRSEALQLDNTISWYSIWNFTLLIRTNIQVIRRDFVFFSPLIFLTLRMTLTL